MKNYILLFFCLVGNYFYSQQGNVGINTSTPEARLEVQAAGNTFSTTSLSMKGNSGTNVFSLHDNGFLGVNNNAPQGVFHISANTAGNNLLISRGAATRSFAGVSHTPTFRHVRYASGGSFNNGNRGGQLLLFDVSANAANDNTLTNGVSIMPANSTVPSGIYLASNGMNGFSLDRMPTVRMDVGGNVRLREYGNVITAGASCTNRSGEILYYKGHFFGCAGNVWTQLDN